MEQVQVERGFKSNEAPQTRDAVAAQARRALARLNARAVEHVSSHRVALAEVDPVLVARPLLRHRASARAERELMAAAETRQMSDVETTQMHSQYKDQWLWLRVRPASPCQTDLQT